MIIPSSCLVKSIRPLKPRDNGGEMTSESCGLVRTSEGFDRWPYSLKQAGNRLWLILWEWFAGSSKEIVAVISSFLSVNNVCTRIFHRMHLFLALHAKLSVCNANHKATHSLIIFSDPLIMTFRKKTNNWLTLTAGLASIYYQQMKRGWNDTRANQNWILSIELKQALLDSQFFIKLFNVLLYESSSY